MSDNCYWTVIMYILYDSNLFNKFEDFANKVSINRNIKVIDLPEKTLGSLLKKFLTETDDIDTYVREELLLYCKKIE